MTLAELREAKEAMRRFKAPGGVLERFIAWLCLPGCPLAKQKFAGLQALDQIAAKNEQWWFKNRHRLEAATMTLVLRATLPRGVAEARWLPKELTHPVLELLIDMRARADEIDAWLGQLRGTPRVPDLLHHQKRR